MAMVYLVTHSESGKAYVGQTCRTLAARKTEHQKPGSKNCRLLSRAIQKHGTTAFVWSVLHDDVSAEEALALEVKEIEDRGTLSPAGYNLTKGGEGGLKSPEAKEAHSLGNRRRYVDPVEREKTSRGVGAAARKPESRKRRAGSATRQWADPTSRARIHNALVSAYWELTRAKRTCAVIMWQLGAGLVAAANSYEMAPATLRKDLKSLGLTTKRRRWDKVKVPKPPRKRNPNGTFMKRILPLLPVLLLAQCWTLPQPAHATGHETPARLDEGSHGAWTRCAAGVLGSRIKSCVTHETFTVCEDRNGRSVWSTVWQKNLGAVYLSTGGDAPVRMGEYIVQDTLTDARFVVGSVTYRCQVVLEDGYMKVRWGRI